MGNVILSTYTRLSYVSTLFRSQAYLYRGILSSAQLVFLVLLALASFSVNCISLEVSVSGGRLSSASHKGGGVLGHRHGLHNTKRPIENLPPPNKTPPSFHMLSVALSDTSSDDVKEQIGHRSMANSLVGGNINSRKTRSLLFVKTEPKPDQSFQGNYYFTPVSNFVVNQSDLLITSRNMNKFVADLYGMGKSSGYELSANSPPVTQAPGVNWTSKRQSGGGYHPDWG